MAAHVQVPAQDIAEGRATPGLGGASTLRIGCSQRQPSDAFAAVAYRGRYDAGHGLRKVNKP
ncbi:MAG TPA: hypothetical protein PKM73_09950 [Verrucomicrobiota bacterium]|nr:hypothetical protein [Verrucomicrobiota bacterium]